MVWEWYESTSFSSRCNNSSRQQLQQAAAIAKLCLYYTPEHSPVLVAGYVGGSGQCCRAATHINSVGPLVNPAPQMARGCAGRQLANQPNQLV